MRGHKFPLLPGYKVNDPAAAAEHEAYKKAYKTPNPDPEDPCGVEEDAVRRVEELIDAMEDWDEKWWPPEYIPRHAKAIEQRKNELQNAQARLSACRAKK